VLFDVECIELVQCCFDVECIELVQCCFDVEWIELVQCCVETYTCSDTGCNCVYSVLQGVRLLPTHLNNVP
jgi:hypothetical protein